MTAVRARAGSPRGGGGEMGGASRSRRKLGHGGVPADAGLPTRQSDAITDALDAVAALNFVGPHPRRGLTPVDASTSTFLLLADIRRPVTFADVRDSNNYVQLLAAEPVPMAGGWSPS